MLKTIVATLQTVMGSSLSQQSAVDTISQWKAKPPSELIFDSGRREIIHYFEAVDRLRHRSSSNTLKNFNDEFISAAMERLSIEFNAVLRRQVELQPGPISTTGSTFTDSTAYLSRYDEYSPYEPPSHDVVDYLRNIAQRMTTNGKLGECVRIYTAARRSFLQAELKRIRFDDLNLGLNSRRYVWDELRVKMESWAHVCKICVLKLFEREKKLCDRIFQGLAGDECFVGTVGESAGALFNFAEVVSQSNHPYEKLENILGVYNSFTCVLPDANRLFNCKMGEKIRAKCVDIQSKVETDVARLLCEFENAVAGEIPSSADETSAVHPLTVYVMDQIAIVVKNKDLLEKLIKSPPEAATPAGVGDGRGFLGQHVILIVFALQTKLESKCQVYQNPALGRLFMMNNLRHISRRVNEDAQLREMIGEPYRTKLDDNLRAAKDGYEDMTCRRFLACFEDKGLYVALCFGARLSRSAVRKRVRDFNVLYEEFGDLNSSWTVPDLELRDKVRVSLCERLVPAYLEFLDKLRDDPQVNMVLHNHVKYSGDEFQALILENLFA